MGPSTIDVRCAAPWLVALACALGACAVRAQETPSDDPDVDAGPALEDATPLTAAKRQRAVYVCLDGGVPIFADRPCGATSETRLLTIAAAAAGAPSTRPPPPSAGTTPGPRRPVPSDATEDPAPDRCRALQRQLEEIDDRMRSGYSAREAARLWHRWRDAKERLRDARC
jgi:hypothetical protein